MSKERLVELIKRDNCQYPCLCSSKCKYVDEDDCHSERLADIILADGWIRPPCKVGDRVYMVIHDKRTKKPLECNVIGFWYTEHEDCCSIHLSRYVNGKFDSTFSVRFTDIGKTIFFSREEAEAKLREVTQNG